MTTPELILSEKTSAPELTLSEALLQDIESNCCDKDLSDVSENSASEMVRHILGTFHKRERGFIKEINSYLTEMKNDLPNDHDSELWLIRWRDFVKCHLDHFNEEEKVVFADLLKVEKPLEEGKNPQAMHMGTLSRPFWDLENEHQDAIHNLRSLKKALQHRLPEFPSLQNLSNALENFYSSIIEHIHYETFVLYPAVLKLEATLCH